MNYLKGNTFHKSRDLGDLNVWLLNLTFSVNHTVRGANDSKVLINSQNLYTS